jgi:inner membrane transporter RhtA
VAAAAANTAATGHSAAASRSAGAAGAAGVRKLPAGQIPPQALFVTGAISQYLGSALAVSLFAHIAPAGVAWLRVLTAGVVMCAWRQPWRARWSREVLALAAAFGLVLGLMNLTFYEAIARLPLGTAVAIEFAGPIAVAALGSRTRRDGLVLALATAGVALLADVRIGGSPAGVAFALAAAAMWAAYIALGHRLANHRELRPQDGLASSMLIGGALLAPWLAPAASPAFGDAGLLAQCLLIGVACSVVPYALEQITMRRLGRARFAVLLALLPATAAIVGAVALAQVPRPLEAVGIALVIAASALRSHTRTSQSG